jgi:hypothetical protein
MLYSCYIDNFILANGLRGNSRMKSLKLSISTSDEVSNRTFLAIAGALKENKGLVDLNLSYSLRLNDGTWDAICDSLKTHPTLKVLNLWSITAPAVIKSQIQALVDMVKVNTMIHTIYLDADYSHPELYRRSVIPYLETNRFRPRVRAIQQIRPIPYRVKVLGRALLSARTDPNRFWMLLSGNAEVTFPPTTVPIAAAGNLTTPATAAAICTANATYVMSALTTTATASLPTAAVATAVTDTAASAVTPFTASASDACTPAIATAAYVATPPDRQKRKVRP